MFFKEIYRRLKLFSILALSRGKALRIIDVNPQDIQFGQLPHNQFSPRDTLIFTRDGDWDRETIPVTEHLLYKSYEKHFVDGVAWEETPFYKMAEEKINCGEGFRGEYYDVSALKLRFDKCETLFKEIKKSGFKSNRQLFKEKKINNILSLLDEVTVNVSREGDYLLNDGWHRFATARILGLSHIPVRVLVKHAKAYSQAA